MIRYPDFIKILASFGITTPQLAYIPLGAYAWAHRPSAETYSGRTIIVTDIGADGVGSLWRSDGTIWRRLHAVRFYDTGAAVTVTNTTTETTVAAMTIPGNALGPSGKIKIWPLLSMTNSANNKTIKITFGGQTLYSAVGFTSMAQMAQLIVIRNKTASTQVCVNGAASGIGNTTGSVGTGTVDTRTDQTLAMTVKMAALAETITLEGFFVELV